MVPLATPDPVTALLAVGVLGLSLLWWLSVRRPSGIPPGPGFALPLIGHLHLMEKDPRQLFRKWRQQYGDVFSLYFGGRLVVVLNGYDVIKEAYVKLADFTSDRPHYFLSDKVWDNAGVIFTSGATWKEQRKTSLEILRQLGMGKNSLAEKIQEEVGYYIRAIEDQQGEPTELAALTQVSVSNNICSIVFGQRFQFDDPVFKSYMHAFDEFVNNVGVSGAANVMPKPERWPWDLLKAKKLMGLMSHVEDTFLRQQIASHTKTFSETSVDDFIHAYIDQMKKLQQAGKATTLSGKHLLKITLDLFLAGNETTTTSIGWTLLFFLHHPEIQEKCYKEICDVVGTGRTPNMADKPKMTYMEATTMETLRLGQIAPFCVFHDCNDDIMLRGYVIPRHAMFLANLSSVMTDPALWGDPEKFRPERFIDPDGSLIKREELIPFGIGRRVCLGESLARTELFLYLSTLVQRFRFLPEDPEKLPLLEGLLGGTHIPKPYKIRAVLRE